MEALLTKTDSREGAYSSGVVMMVEVVGCSVGGVIAVVDAMVGDLDRGEVVCVDERGCG